MKNCYIVSLKYAPGMVKEFFLLGDKLSEAGYNVIYLLTEGYRNLNKENSVYITDSDTIPQIARDTFLFPFTQKNKVKQLFDINKPDLTICYNPHPLNSQIMKLAFRSSPESKRVLCLHEPGKRNKSVYGIKGWLVFGYLESTLIHSLKACSDVVVHSPYASEILSRRLPEISSIMHQCPLLMPDTPGKEQARDSFCMVGRINYTKRLDDLLDLISYCDSKQMDYKFKVTTPCDISSDLEKMSGTVRSMISVIHDQDIIDRHINDTLSGCYAVFCIHKNVVQSGVVPQAFMNSTPVIARNDPGFTQHVIHKHNGYILPDDYSATDMADAMAYVKNNFKVLSDNARKTYLDVFSPSQWVKYYDWI